jgi:hypothetical protein
MRTNIFGIDLSGPSNTKESTLVSFEARNKSLQMTTALGESVWIFKSEMPFHPYDFVC